MSAPDPFGEVIHSYTRCEAIADGVLCDVSDEACNGMLRGLKVPMAVTAALMAAVRAIPPSLVGLADERGRLHDVLWMAAVDARRRASQSSIRFKVHLPSSGTRKRVRELLVVIGPGDDGGPCVTIGFPEDF